MFYDAALILYDGAYVAERWADLKEFVSENEDKVFPVTKKILQSGGTEEKTAARLFEDLHMLQYYRHKAKEILKKCRYGNADGRRHIHKRTSKGRSRKDEQLNGTLYKSLQLA